MGNSESTPSTPSRREKERDAAQNRQANNGTSSVPVGKKATPRTYTPTPPHLSSSASTSTSNEYAQASHSRSRSQTTPSAPVAMGNSESKARPPSRSSTLNSPPPTEKRQASPLSRPVDVPQHAIHEETDAKDELTPPSADSPFGIPASVYVDPPRLPIAIEHPEPESPIISPQDLEAPPLENETDETILPKRTSLLSTTTLDEEDEDGGADIQQFAMETDSLAPKVPTTLTWKGEGRLVYVTGTFALWEKKFRMHRSATGVFSTTIPLTPGTHHITFLVDGDPKTSRDLPTTVDFANALVNYIEVVAPQSPTVEKQPSEALPIPGAKVLPDRTGKADPSLPAVDDQPIPGAPHTTDELAAIVPGTNQSSLRPHSLPNQPPPPQPPPQPTQPHHRQQTQQPPLKQPIPRAKYTSTIPDLLLHLDLYATPEDERYRRASKATQHLPHPPSLPMFMSKSILNATTPKNDDASVLTMPNHTVLNHLATSSIRSGVLATSGTTRYKRKFLTTIMYKPTSDDG